MLNKTTNRAALKAWNSAGFTRKPSPPKSSWWTVACHPDQRDAFIDVAKARHAEQGWSNIIGYESKAVR